MTDRAHAGDPTGDVTDRRRRGADRGFPAPPSRPADLLTRLVLVIGLGVWIVNALILLLGAAPLNPDEAQYAIAARDMIAGSEPRWFYLSRGMNVVASVGILAGESELALRIVPFVLGIGFVLAVWQLARTTFGSATAAWVVAVVAGTRSFVRLSVELLSDLPATTHLLAAMAVIAAELPRDEGPRWRVVIAAPLLAAAFYLRYASCVPIAIIGVSWVALGWRGIVRRPAPVIATAALFLVLFVPHAIMADHATGSPLGILLESRLVPANEYAGKGLVTYFTTNPFAYYGRLTPPIMIIGLLVLRRDRRVVFLWIVAAVSTIAIGFMSDAQVRYVMLGTALLTMLGVDVIRRWIVARPRRFREVLVACATAATVLACLLMVRDQRRIPGGRVKRMTSTLAAAAAIRQDAAGRACHVVANYFTQVAWYGHCPSARYSPSDAIAHGELSYVVDDPGAPWRPDFQELPGQPRMILDVPGVIRVARLDPVAPAPSQVLVPPAVP